jgi:hypothetical protein
MGMKIHRLALLFAAAGALASAQPVSKAAGHWEGALKAPGQDVAIIVNLAQNAKGEWIGSMLSPQQGAQDMPLGGISVQGTAVRFSMAGVPGAPVFEAKLNADGSEMSGACSSGGQSMLFSLKRTGEAKVNLPPPSSQLSKEFEGNWEGALEAGGAQLHLVLKLTRKPDGSGAGSVVSVDQGNAELGINTITQKDKAIEFEIRAVTGGYKGALNAEGTEIAGTWTQMGNSAPLTFKRAAQPK